MVTVPVLAVASGLKGSNLPPSCFSESPSGFLSVEFGAPEDAAKHADVANDADAVNIRAAARTARKFNRLMISPSQVCHLNDARVRTNCAAPQSLAERASVRTRRASSS